MWASPSMGYSGRGRRQLGAQVVDGILEPGGADPQSQEPQEEEEEGEHADDQGQPHEWIGETGAAFAVDDDGGVDAAPPVDGAVDQVEVDDAGDAEDGGQGR